MGKATLWLDDPERHNNPYLTLAGGSQFHFFDFGPESINIYAIAHSLARICRFAGHGRYYYSVAAHSLRVAKRIKELGGTVIEQLWGLLHDGSEFVVTDIPTPFKHQLSFTNRKTGEQMSVTQFEELVQEAIAKKFELPWPMPEIVHRADQELLHIEAAEMFEDAPFEEMSIDRVQVEFWRLFTSLSNERNQNG